MSSNLMSGGNREIEAVLRSIRQKAAHEEQPSKRVRLVQEKSVNLQVHPIKRSRNDLPPLSEEERSTQPFILSRDDPFRGGASPENRKESPQPSIAHIPNQTGRKNTGALPLLRESVVDTQILKTSPPRPMSNKRIPVHPSHTTPNQHKISYISEDFERDSDRPNRTPLCMGLNIGEKDLSDESSNSPEEKVTRAMIRLRESRQKAQSSSGKSENRKKTASPPADNKQGPTTPKLHTVPQSPAPKEKTKTTQTAAPASQAIQKTSTDPRKRLPVTKEKVEQKALPSSPSKQQDRIDKLSKVDQEDTPLDKKESCKESSSCIESPNNSPETEQENLIARVSEITPKNLRETNTEFLSPLVCKWICENVPRLVEEALRKELSKLQGEQGNPLRKDSNCPPICR